jgi:hypothetical protein
MTSYIYSWVVVSGSFAIQPLQRLRPNNEHRRDPSLDCLGVYGAATYNIQNLFLRKEGGTVYGPWRLA